jgi:transcriptional regulator with XRE-family HTH domain
MKDINISTILAEKRREKGETQDQIAAYIGVSKASVSKWETGQYNAPQCQDTIFKI